jgi:hypothetical protein
MLLPETTYAEATKGRKAVRFGPSWPIGNTTPLSPQPAQFLVATSQHRIDICDYRTRVLGGWR